MASIYDTEGQRIAEAILELPTNGTTAELHHIKKGAALLNFYFGKGGRWVIVDTPDGQMRARLHTRWEGARRRWEVTLTQPISTALVPMPTMQPLNALTAVVEREPDRPPSQPPH